MRLGGRIVRVSSRMAALAIIAVLALVAAPSPIDRREPEKVKRSGGSVPVASPRISDWCPDTDRQSLESIARYDCLSLYDGDRKVIPALRALNPDIIILNNSSAVEVHVRHELLKQLPTAWFLTQAGSRLTVPVSATSTEFPVHDTKVFRAGQLAVIGNELIKIESVKTGKIVVRRQVVGGRPPSTSHAVRTRVAAVAGNRPGEIEMDLSTYCPKVTVEASVGPETWGQYAARLQAQRCASGDWDGVIADRVEGKESYLVSNGLVQSIDPTRSNQRPTDGYAAFDRAWEAGLRAHLAAVRRLVGPGKLVVGNNARRNGDLLNGSAIEGFPKTGTTFIAPLLANHTYPRYWRRGRDYYASWSKAAGRPNISTVLTYDDEAPPTNSGVSPGSVSQPDYQKMRFGLATALTGDGFFSYQLAVWGPRVGLFWFDEYDNAGKGKGYLGKPLGAARLALPALSTPDHLGGSGAFTPRGFATWRMKTSPGYTASRALKTGRARITVSRSRGDSVRASFYRDSVSVRSGTAYTVSFRARAAKPTKINVRVTMKNAPWRDHVAFYDVDVGTSWRDYELSTISKGSDGAARFVFDLGKSVNTVWLDDARLQRGSRTDVYRRDFTGGVVLVNGSETGKTIALGGTFKKIRGSQVPKVNDGKSVGKVFLPPRDGLILLRDHLELKNGAKTTRSTKVSAVSRVPGAARMRFSTDGGTDWTPWIPYASTTNVSLGQTLPVGSAPATRTVRAEYQHSDGFITKASASISLLPAPRLERSGGADRYATCLAVADRSHPATAAAVVLASGEDFPDALCAAPLAAAYRAPVLLTPSARLHPSVSEKVMSLRPSLVFIVGGSAAISEEVSRTVADMPWRPRVIRLGGGSRYQTASLVAAQIAAKRGTVSRVVVASGKTHTDALAAAPLASAKGWPILLVKPAEVPTATSAAIDSLRRRGLSSALVVGDRTRVSESVGLALDVSAERITGANPDELSKAMATYSSRNGASTATIAIASSVRFADALSCGPLLAAPTASGSGFGILLFTSPDPRRPDRLPAGISSWLASRRADPHIERIIAIGGQQAVSDAHVSAAAALLD